MKGSLFTALMLGSVALPALALAQTAKPKDEGIPDIIVTADKTSRPLQKVPMAASVISGEQIAKEGRTKLDDILANTPGVEVQGVARGFAVNIRGLGLNLPPQNGAGAVSTNYDGAYSSRGEAASTGFYDLDRVEALRGPQSTIYGRNAVGGVVNIVTRDPEIGKLGGYVQGEVGDYNNMRGEGAVNVPLGDSLALRVAAAGVTRDGYISNGRDDNKAAGFRAKLLFKPNSNYSVLLGYEQTILGGKGPGAIPVADYQNGDRNTTDPSAGYQHHVAKKFWGVLKADIGPGQLFVEPSYQQLSGIVQGALGGNFANNYDPLYTDQFAVEARYGSKPGAKWQWDVGLFHYNNHGTGGVPISGACFSPGTGAGQGVVYLPAPGFSNAPAGPPGSPCVTTAYATDFGVDARTTDTDSVFGQVTAPVMPSLRLILGGRYSWVTLGGSTDLNNNNTNGATGTPLTTPDVVQLATVKEKYFDFRAGFEWDVAPSSLIYATAASGHREGGYGFAPPLTAPSAYKPEDMVGYEIGFKNKLLGGKLIINADVFYYDYKQYQLVYVNFASGGFPFQFTTFPAREYGGEIDANWNVTQNDHLTGSIAYLNSRLKTDAVNGPAYDGEPFTFAPEWTLKLSYSHDFDLGSAGRITPRVDFRSLSKQLVTANAVEADLVNNAVSPQAPDGAAVDDYQKAYVTGDAFIGWTSANRKYSVNAYVKNINDKLIKSSNFFGYVQVQAPRTYGATVNIKF